MLPSNIRGELQERTLSCMDPGDIMAMIYGNTASFGANDMSDAESLEWLYDPVKHLRTTNQEGFVMELEGLAALGQSVVAATR